MIAKSKISKTLIIKFFIILLLIPLLDLSSTRKALALQAGDSTITNLIISSKNKSGATTSINMKWNPPVRNGYVITEYSIEIKNIDTLAVVLTTTATNENANISAALDEGSRYSIKVVPTFNADNTNNEDYGATLNFVNEFSRPTFVLAESGLQKGTDLLKGDQIKNVDPSAKVVLTVKDDLPINNFAPNSILVKDENGTVSGSTTWSAGTGTNVYLLTFSPTDNWVPGKTYTVSTNLTLLDNAGNLVYPILFKFTTAKANWTATNSGFYNTNLKTGENPHGILVINKNVCFNCHGTQKTLNLTGTDTVKTAATQFCLTCHDGTSATSVTGSGSVFTHGNQVNMGTNECSDCHDTHLSWSVENPNSLKGTYVFQHKKNGSDILYYPNGEPVTDAKKPCVTCHGEKTAEYKKKALDVAFTGPGNVMRFEPYQYKKQATTSGKTEDMSLCLNCHNGSNSKATNISKFYNATPSLDNTSGHKILFGDRGEGLLQGYLTCSDCHETHGSDNIYMLKKELGHESISSTPYQSSSVAGDTEPDPKKWSIAKERAFCLKCHNNSTNVYGVVSKFVADSNDSNAIRKSGHTTSSSSCSFCHGGSGDESSKFIQAGHAPLQSSYIPPSP